MTTPLDLPHAVSALGAFSIVGGALPRQASPKLRVRLTYRTDFEARAMAAAHGMRWHSRPPHLDRPTTYIVEAQGGRAREAAASAIHLMTNAQRAHLEVVIDEVTRRRDLRRVARAIRCSSPTPLPPVDRPSEGHSVTRRVRA